MLMIKKSECSNQKSQYGEADKDNKKESLEKQDNTMAWNNTKNNKSSIGLHMIDQKVEIIKPTKVNRTKPRALVSTTFEVFTFKPLDSQVYEESETESMISIDDEG